MSLNDKAASALRRELAKCFPERAENDPGHARLADALSDTARPRTMDDDYTPGALAAARVIMNGRDRIKTEYGEKTVYGIADLIDRKTSAPELLEVLRSCDRLAGCQGNATDVSLAIGEIRTIARAAIARAEGGAA